MSRSLHPILSHLMMTLQLLLLLSKVPPLIGFGGRRGIPRGKPEPKMTEGFMHSTDVCLEDSDYVLT
jgi:hypothetical protein